MFRFVTGIVLLTFCLLSIISFLIDSNTKESVSSLIYSIIVFGAGGSLLVYFGNRFRVNRKLIINNSLRMLKEEGFIDIVRLADKLNLSLDFVQKIVLQQQHKGIIPQNALETIVPNKGRSITCPNCHFEVRARDTYCQNCGRKI